MPDWLYRELRDTDLPFVQSSWLRSHRMSMPDFSDGAYYGAMAKRIDRLRREGATTVIACNPENTDYIVGWICFGPAAGVVHYCYVRDLERNRGTARDMLENIMSMQQVSEVYATHTTQYLETIARAHPEIRIEPSHLEEKTHAKNQARIREARHGN